MKKLIYILILVPILLTSCMGINTTPYVNNPVSTSVDLSNGNFKIVKVVTGEVTAKYVFGFGGGSQKVLKSNAIAEMYKNADLQGSQTIANVSVSTSVKSVLGVIVMVRTAVATGYVIEFDGPRCPNCGEYNVNQDVRQTTSSISQQTVVEQKKVQEEQKNAQKSISQSEEKTEQNPQSENVGSDAKVKIYDSNLEKILLGLYDKDKNGFISEKEALLVTKISITACGIKTLNGIEAFKNLEILNASNNKFSVVVLNKNLKLKEVKIDSDVLKNVYLSKKQSLTIDAPENKVKYVD